MFLFFLVGVEEIVFGDSLFCCVDFCVLIIFGVENFIIFMFVVILVVLSFLGSFLFLFLVFIDENVLLNFDIDRDFLIKFKGMWFSILLK